MPVLRAYLCAYDMQLAGFEVQPGVRAGVDMHGFAGGGAGGGRSPHPPSNMQNTKHACPSCMRICVQTGDLHFTGCDHEKDQDILHHNPAAAGLIG